MSSALPEPRGQTRTLQPTEDLALPARVKGHEGEWVDTTTDGWRLPIRDGSAWTLAINLDRIWKEAQLTDRAQAIVRRYLAHRLETVKPKTVAGDVDSVRLFLRWWCSEYNGKMPFDWQYVDEVGLRRFLEWGLRRPNQGNDFARIRAIYRWGAVVKELPDFDTGTFLLLKGIRAPGNDKGHAVRGWDDEKGPFNLDEYNLILDALQKRAGTAAQRTLVRTFLETGVRPLVLTMVQKRHLHRFEAPIQGIDGSIKDRVEYYLDVPVLKGRKAKIERWKRRPISRMLGRRFERLTQDQPASAPLFGASARHSSQILTRWADAANLTSPRTGGRLVLKARRFRYTLGTFMAMQGHSRVEIAEALDHTDLQNVEVYIDAAAEFMSQLKAPIERALGPAIRRFLGQVAAATDAPVDSAIPAAVTHLPEFPMITGSIGWCGRDPKTHGLCQLAHPLACYGCSLFTAFRNGPHHEIGDALERLISDNDGETTSPLLVGQLRGSLVAVRQLEAQIEAEEADV